MTTTSPVKSSRPKRGSINKRAILDAAALMFHEKGYDRTTLDDIAGALSVTKPSLYYHFSNKEEILIECVATADEHLQAELLAQDDKTLNGRRRVEIFLRLYLDIMSHDIGVSMVLADDRVMSEAGRHRYNEFRRILNRQLEDRIQAGVADGSIDAPETKLTTYALFGMFNWVGHWNFRRKAIPAEAILERFMSVAFDGIGAKPAAT